MLDVLSTLHRYKYDFWPASVATPHLALLRLQMLKCRLDVAHAVALLREAIDQTQALDNLNHLQF